MTEKTSDLAEKMAVLDEMQKMILSLKECNTIQELGQVSTTAGRIYNAIDQLKIEIRAFAEKS